jgi:hypothetical protein
MEICVAHSGIEEIARVNPGRRSQTRFAPGLSHFGLSAEGREAALTRRFCPEYKP